MLDLNPMALSSLLGLELPDTTELEQSSLKDEQQEDNDISVDPNAFVFLMSQIITQPDSEPVGLMVRQEQSEQGGFECGKEAQSQTVTGDAPLNDNVAVAWINSEYYQTKISTDTLQNDVKSTQEDLANTKTGLIGSENRANDLHILKSESFPLNNVKNTLEHYPNVNMALSADQAITLNKNTGFELQPSVINNQADEKLIESSSLSEEQSQQLVTSRKTADMAIQSSVFNDQFEVNDEEAQAAVEKLPFLQKPLKNAIEITTRDTNKSQATTMFSLDSLDKTKNDEQDMDIEPQIAESESSPKINVELDTSNEAKKLFNLIDESITNNSQANNELQTNPALTFNNVQNITELSQSSDVKPFAIPQSVDFSLDIEHPQGATQFAEHAVWLGQQGLQRAVIKVHPEELGPIEISVRVINNSASIDITSHSQQVRDIIDQSLPRLHEMMSEQGLSLSDVNIDSERGSRQFGHQHGSTSQESTTFQFEKEDEIIIPAKKQTTPKGMVDYFA